MKDFPFLIPFLEAVKTGATVSMILVPAPWALDAIPEAAEADIELNVCITEGIPVRDMVMVKRYLQDSKMRLGWPELPRCDYSRWT